MGKALMGDAIGASDAASLAAHLEHDRASLGVEQRGMLDAATRVLAGLHGGGAT
jgi:hypothetical protein